MSTVSSLPTDVNGQTHLISPPRKQPDRRGYRGNRLRSVLDLLNRELRDYLAVATPKQATVVVRLISGTDLMVSSLRLVGVLPAIREEVRQ